MSTAVSLRTLRRLVAPGMLIAAGLAVTGAPATIAVAAAPQLVITAPTEVALGSPIQVGLQLSDADGVAGLEVSSQFDATAVEFGGVYFGGQGDDHGNIVTTVADDPGTGASWMAYTCVTLGCPAPSTNRDALTTARLR